MLKIRVFKQTNRYLLLSLCLLLNACVVLPLERDNINDPALQKIHHAFATTIDDAFNDPNENWTSGWLGNMWVNFHEGTQRGLCYQWKYRIHAGVKETVLSQGWQLTGIVINQGKKGEHHAVIIYDPKKITPDKIVNANTAQPVFVLDAWRRGKPDIYRVSDWLKLARNVHKPAHLISIL